MANITTNHNWRQFKYGYEVPEKVLDDDFDHLTDDDKADGFICYRGTWYHVSEFMRIEDNNPFHPLGWHGYTADSYFSGILIRLSDDGEEYQVATYIS